MTRDLAYTHVLTKPVEAVELGFRTVIGTLSAAFAAVDTWEERWRQRRALARLDDRLLRDIGVTRADAAAETDKPFWRP